MLKEGPAIHPLLAQFARGLDEGQILLSEFSTALSARASQTNREVDQTGNYGLFAPLLPHVRTVAEAAEAAGLEKAGSLWNSLGYHIHAMADYPGAKAAYKHVIKIWEANLGPDHPYVATGVNNLGGVLQDMGDLAGAKAAYERALKIDETVHGSSHPQVARDLNNMGVVLHTLGDQAGAQAAFERALAIIKKFLPPDHPTIRIARNNLKGLQK